MIVARVLAQKSNRARLGLPHTKGTCVIRSRGRAETKEGARRAAHPPRLETMRKFSLGSSRGRRGRTSFRGRCRRRMRMAVIMAVNVVMNYHTATAAA